MFLSEQIHSLDNECPVFVIQPQLIPSQWMAAFEGERMLIQHELSCKIRCP